MTKLKNSKWEKTQRPRCDSSKNSNHEKTLKNIKCDKSRTQNKIKMWQNSNCGKPQNIKM